MREDQDPRTGRTRPQTNLRHHAHPRPCHRTRRHQTLRCWRSLASWAPSPSRAARRSREGPMRPKPRRTGVLSTDAIRPCALVRVSSDEQVDQFSLPMQLVKITDHCQQHLGVALADAAIFREEGVSGRTGTLKKRPGLSAALEACLAGAYTHLVVHKLDRLGRNVGLVSSVLETLEQHGIIFVSVQDRVDASTAAGRLYIAIFVAIAQWYSDNLSEETKKGKEGRKRAGLYNGILPFGAMRGEGVHAVPLPDLRPITLVGADGVSRPTTNHAGLLQAFTWCGQGHSAREIAAKLNQAGYRTVGTWGSNPFTKDTVQKLVGNRFYLGELPDGQGGWVPGKHSALVPHELWDQAQAVRRRQQRNPQTIPGTARVHVLGGGLLRCGPCWVQGRSSPLHVVKSRQHLDTAYYACYGRIQGHACTQSSVPEHLLEQQITAFFDAFSLAETEQQRLIDLYLREQQSAPVRAGPDPVARRAQLEARLERQRELYELGDWPRDRYLQARQAVLSELDTMMASAAQRREQQADVLGRLSAYVRGLTLAWADADKANRRLLVRTLFEQLWVVGDRILAVKPVAQFAPFFALLRRREEGDEALYLAPGSGWEADTQTVGALATEMARETVARHWPQAEVRTVGTDQRLLSF